MKKKSQSYWKLFEKTGHPLFYSAYKEEMRDERDTD